MNEGSQRASTSTNEGSQRASTIRTGRPLDEAGEPTAGAPLELDVEGVGAALVRASPRPLVSSPGSGTWATLLATPDERLSVPGDHDALDGLDATANRHGDRPVLVQWLGPDASEPPAHVHPTTETFRVVAGELTLECGGETRRLGPGGETTVPTGVEHAFRNDTGEQVVFVAWLPSMRTARALYSVWGMDHEGVFGDGPPGDPGRYGEPDPLRGLLLAESLRGETTMTAAPRPLQRVLWATVGRLARAAGYRAVDDRYLTDEFWERRVEQPSL